MAQSMSVLDVLNESGYSPDSTVSQIEGGMGAETSLFNNLRQSDALLNRLSTAPVPEQDYGFLTLNIPDTKLTNIASFLPRMQRLVGAIPTDVSVALMSLGDLLSGNIGRGSNIQFYEDYLKWREGVSDTSQLPWWKQSSIYAALSGQPTFSDYIEGILHEANQNKGLLYNLWSIGRGATEAMPLVALGGIGPVAGPILMGAAAGVQEVPQPASAVTEPDLFYDIAGALTMGMAPAVGSAVSRYIGQPIYRRIAGEVTKGRTIPEVVIPERLPYAGAPFAEITIPPAQQSSLLRALGTAAISPTPNIVRTGLQQTISQIPMGLYFGATGTLTDLMRGNIEDIGEKFKEHTLHGIGVGLALHALHRLPAIRPGQNITYESVKKYFTTPYDIYKAQKADSSEAIRIALPEQKYPIISATKGELLTEGMAPAGMPVEIRPIDKENLERLVVNVWNDLSNKAIINPEEAQREIAEIRSGSPIGQRLLVGRIVEQLQRDGELIREDVISEDKDNDLKQTSAFYRYNGTVFNVVYRDLRLNDGSVEKRPVSFDFWAPQTYPMHPVGQVLATSERGKEVTPADYRLIEALRYFNEDRKWTDRNEAINYLRSIAKERGLEFYNEYGYVIPDDFLRYYRSARYSSSVRTPTGEIKPGILMGKFSLKPSDVPEESVAVEAASGEKGKYAVILQEAYTDALSIISNRIKNYADEYDREKPLAGEISKKEYVSQKLQEDDEVVDALVRISYEYGKELDEAQKIRLNDALAELYNDAVDLPNAYYEYEVKTIPEKNKSKEYLQKYFTQGEGTLPEEKPYPTYLERISQEIKEKKAKKSLLTPAVEEKPEQPLSEMEMERQRLLAQMGAATPEAREETPAAPATEAPVVEPAATKIINSLRSIGDELIGEKEADIIYKNRNTIIDEIDSITDGVSLMRFIWRYFPDKVEKFKTALEKKYNEIRSMEGMSESDISDFESNLFGYVKNILKQKAESIILHPLAAVKYEPVEKTGIDLDRLTVNADKTAHNVLGKILLDVAGKENIKFIAGKNRTVFEPSSDDVGNAYNNLSEYLSKEKNVINLREKINKNKDLNAYEKQIINSIIDDLVVRSNSGNDSDIVWITGFLRGLSLNQKVSDAINTAETITNDYQARKAPSKIETRPEMAEPAAEAEIPPEAKTVGELNRLMQQLRTIISTNEGWEDFYNKYRSGDIRILRIDEKTGAQVPVKKISSPDELAEIFRDYDLLNLNTATFEDGKTGVIAQIKKKISRQGVSLAAQRKEKQKKASLLKQKESPEKKRPSTGGKKKSLLQPDREKKNKKK